MNYSFLELLESRLILDGSTSGLLSTPFRNHALFTVDTSSAISYKDLVIIAQGEIGPSVLATVAVYNTSDGSLGVVDGSILAQFSRLQLAATSNKVVVAGAELVKGDPNIGDSKPSDVIDVYDVNQAKWTVVNLGTLRYDGTLLATGANAYLGGLTVATGKGLPNFYAVTSQVQRYGLLTGKLSSSKLSQARTKTTGIAANGKAIFAGGLKFKPDSDQASNVVDFINDKSGKRSSAKLSAARFSMAAIQTGDEVLFAGGATSNTGYIPSGYSNAIDIYHQKTNKWSKATLSQPTDAVSAGTIGTKTFLAIGDVAHPAVDILDSVIGSWSTSPLPNARPGFPLNVATVGSKAIFSYGNTIADVYDTTTALWSTINVCQANETNPLFARIVSATVGHTAYVQGSSGSLDSIVDINPSAVLSGSVMGGIGHSVKVTIANTGDATLSQPYTVRLYASKDRTLNGAIFVGSKIVISQLDVNASAIVRLQGTVPRKSPKGAYYLLAAVDDGKTVIPIASSDNTFQIGGRTTPSVSGTITGAFTGIIHQFR